MKTTATALFACATLGASLSLSAAELPTQTYLPLDTAQALANAAMKSCTAEGYSVSVTVVDAAGLTRAQLRADKAGPHTLESSRKKAFTSASMGRPSGDLAALIKKMPELDGLRDMDPNLLMLGGGLPLKAGDEKIGGIGVGGAPGGHLDQACAQAAIDNVLGQ
ncbi:GlcG/HbpS family heme-binding protein [Aestuariirhabdus litorea]|uniref:Heme-binding protein n=1 Tax=Aestuariirhabdus litorea TaxID=2528527 RepID=A0A3P3VMI9_9GAMM|nr:heme-binding protein [Aestuariirhabdus litorea]RRJ83981.1 heme-binding protein [Aestuariirhabdus litorea]RWW97201.1 heme-binding protein [Endozoicomonadaceae bacterium GTF-13]